MNHLEPKSVQEQPSEVNYLNKNFLSVDTQAKLVMIDKICQYEPSSPKLVQEQPSEVDSLNKMTQSVETQAQLVMIVKICQ